MREKHAGKHIGAEKRQQSKEPPAVIDQVLALRRQQRSGQGSGNDTCQQPQSQLQ